MPTDPDSNKNLRAAGTVAIWVWILIALSPFVVGFLCCVVGPILLAAVGAASDER